MGNIDQCAGGVANYNGRLVCGTHGGGFNIGSERATRDGGHGRHGGSDDDGGPDRPSRRQVPGTGRNRENGADTGITDVTR